jgi:hypothetical protein
MGSSGNSASIYLMKNRNFSLPWLISGGKLAEAWLHANQNGLGSYLAPYRIPTQDKLLLSQNYIAPQNLNKFSAFYCWME